MHANIYICCNRNHIRVRQRHGGTPTSQTITDGHTLCLCTYHIYMYDKSGGSRGGIPKNETLARAAGAIGRVYEAEKGAADCAPKGGHSPRARTFERRKGVGVMYSSRHKSRDRFMARHRTAAIRHEPVMGLFLFSSGKF